MRRIKMIALRLAQLRIQALRLDELASLMQLYRPIEQAGRDILPARFEPLTRNCLIADGLGVPRPTRSVPLWLARLVAYFMERAARRRRDPNPPRLTQARLKFLGLNLDFSIERARRELGYRPRYTFEEGLARTIAWYRQEAGQR